MDKCRLCYTDPNPDMCQHIFNTRFKPPICKIIEQLSNLKITKNDPYTKNICGQCFIDLVKYNDFRRQILDTDYRLQHEKDQLSEKTSDDGDYFEVHYTPTGSDCGNSIVKEDEIKVEEDPLKIEDESNEELYNRSIAVMDNQDTKEFVIVDGINNNDKLTACYTSPKDSSNETNEIQSSKCNTDDKIDFNRDSTKTDGSNIISTNNNDLIGSDNDDMTISDENESSTAKDIVGSTKNFDDNSSCTNSNNNNNVKREESDVVMSNVGNSIYIKDETRRKVSESTTRCNSNINLKVQNSKTQNTLQNHSRTQTDKTPLECNICNKQISNRGNLWRHKQKHMSQKCYRCNFCNKQFTHKGNFECHIRIHTGEKPYKCKMCDKSFRTRSHLDSHLRVHTGEKPFKCDICNRAFTQHSSLTGHNRRLHVVEKS